MNDQSKVNINESIRRLGVTRAAIKAIEERHKEELEKYHKLEDMLEGIVLQYLQNNNLSSTKTDTGYSAAWYTRTTYRVEDQSEFRRHVIGNEAWELIDWRCNATGAKEFMTSHGDIPPPGVKPNVMAIVRITPPQRPKLETVTTPVENDSQSKTWK